MGGTSHTPGGYITHARGVHHTRPGGYITHAFNKIIIAWNDRLIQSVVGIREIIATKNFHQKNKNSESLNYILNYKKLY